MGFGGSSHPHGCGRRRVELSQHRLVDRACPGVGKQRVEGAASGLASEGGDVDALQLSGQESRGERDGEPGSHKSPDGERVGGEEGNARLEPGGAAGSDYEAVVRGCGPRLMREVDEVDRAAASEAVARRKHDHHRLLGEVVTAEPVMFSAGHRGVLKAHGDMQAPGTHACRELVLPALLDRGPEIAPIA